MGREGCALGPSVVTGIGPASQAAPPLSPSAPSCPPPSSPSSVQTHSRAALSLLPSYEATDVAPCLRPLLPPPPRGRAEVTPSCPPRGPLMTQKRACSRPLPPTNPSQSWETKDSPSCHQTPRPPPPPRRPPPPPPPPLKKWVSPTPIPTPLKTMASPTAGLFRFLFPQPAAVKPLPAGTGDTH